MKRVGIVVPTTFSRPLLLPQALQSLRSNPQTHIVLSASLGTAVQNAELLSALSNQGLVDHVAIQDTEPALPTKIQLAICNLPRECEFVGWLGDDDLVSQDSVDRALKVFDSNSDTVLVYGDCNYIDERGEFLFKNRSGRLATTVLGYGPQLIPQPGALWRRDAFEAVGGLSADFDLAFDYDLFMKLKRYGKISYIPQTLASFRWHPDSLSVKQRWKSAREASRVRIKHQRGPEKLLILLEPAIILATWMAGKLVTRFRLRTNRSSQSK